MVYGLNSFAASIAAVCLGSGMLFLTGCDDDCDECEHDVTYVEDSCPSCPVEVSYYTERAPVYSERVEYVSPEASRPFMDSTYNFSYDTQQVVPNTAYEAGAESYTPRYGREPGLERMGEVGAPPSNIFVRDYTLEGQRRADFARGVRPMGPGVEREAIEVRATQRERGLRPSEMEQPIETSADRAARIDRETSISPGAESSVIYRERVDRSRYFSRDDIRDDDLDVDPAYGRGATLRDQTGAGTDMQFRGETQVSRETRSEVMPSAAADAEMKAQSTTSQPGVDTARVPPAESSTSAATETGANSRVSGTEPGDIGADTDAGAAVDTSAGATTDTEPGK